MTSVIVIALSIPLGCLGAARRGSILDVGLRLSSYVAGAIPAFLLALTFQRFFGSRPDGPWYAVFPASGWGGVCAVPFGAEPGSFRCPSLPERVGPVLFHLLLPSLALALGFAALYARYLRNSLLDALDSGYITVARGKGLPERVVLFRHALRNALVTYTAVAFADLSAFFGVGLAVDYVFRLNGLGTYFITTLQLNVDGVVDIDTYALVTALLFSGALVLAASLVGEILLWRLDPRTRPQ
jgi:peptide/nickel transport system permease protein